MIEAIYILHVAKTNTKKSRFTKVTNPEFEIETATIEVCDRKFVTCLATTEDEKPMEASYILVDIESGVQVGEICDTPELAIESVERLAANRPSRRSLEKQLKKIINHFGKAPEPVINEPSRL